MSAVATVLADIAFALIGVGLWIVVVVALHEFFVAGPRQRKVAAMPPSQREFFTTSTHKTSPRRVERPGS